MKNVVKSTFFKSFLTLIIALFANEIIFRLISGFTLLSWGIVRTIFVLSFVSSIFALIFNFTNKWVRRIGTSILVFASSVYACAQLGFREFIGVYISFQTSSQLGAVKSYIKDFIKSFKWEFYLNIIPFILIILFFIFLDKKLNTEKLKGKVTAIAFSVIMILSSLLIYGSIATKTFQNKFQTVSNMNLFLTASNPSIVIEQYGTVGFCILDVRAMVHPINVKEEIEIKQVQKKEVNENSRIIDDEAWREVANEETNETYKFLNNYFMNREITDKNEYTGMFKNKNLIVIMMESTNDIFLKPEYYPNFNKLVSEGWYFENNYSPRNSCATMNNEFSGMTSLYSIYNTCTASKWKRNKYNQSVFNIFNQQNYVTFSAHDYTQAYYPRKTIHTNMGSGEYYGVEKLGIPYSTEYRNWADDDDFMEKVLKIIDKKTANGEKFMTWLTTVSAHQPYSYSSNQGDKYYSMTKNTRYPTDVRRFMSKLKIQDKGLGILLKGLEERGILDDTVIVLYGDHYPYGISKTNLNKALDYNTKVDLSAERVPLVIYNSQMESKVFSQYTSYINILPTIANLFDVEYDPRFYLGQDALEKDYQSLTVFADGSWKNEKAFYSANKNKIHYYSSDEYTEEEIQAINNDIQEKVNVSNKVIKSNYFNYLDKSVTAKKEELERLRSVLCLNTEKDKFKVEENNQE